MALLMINLEAAPRALREWFKSRTLDGSGMDPVAYGAGEWLDGVRIGTARLSFP
eukprot:m.72107 g.72107  ORF g.72107 m.72107 type:complete len:54 (-) comp18700_c0_seq1:232-393(-)